MPLELDFYYGNEAEQYSFYRIPNALFTDERFRPVSVEAKVLYDLLLDRMGLSIRSGLMDEDGRVYLYFTLEDAMQMIGCGHGKAVKLFSELSKDSGIGLIERKKQGQGRPTKIYVKNFITAPNLQTSQNRKSALPESGSLDFSKSDGSNTDLNNTEFSDTESINSIPQTPLPVDNPSERLDEMRDYRELITENIEYDYLLTQHPYDRQTIDGIVDLMTETVCSRKPYIVIAKEQMPTQVVKSRLLKLDESHVEYVMSCMSENTTKVRNIRSYLLTSLYHAPTTIDALFSALVRHDMYGDKSG